VTPADLIALADVRGYAGANRIHLTRHARLRMDERGTLQGELRAILVAAPSCAIQANGTVRVRGVDDDGDRLDVIVAIDDGVIVVTLFG
jgi:hypothetical protein